MPGYTQGRQGPVGVTKSIINSHWALGGVDLGETAHLSLK